MSSESLNNELNNLERRIKLIISEQAKLKNEVGIYQNENLQLREKISQKERELNSFQNKFKLNQIADNAIESTDPDELKELLNKYIMEIDKCILNLSEA